jgi:isopentenyl-diphosphate delta-isomerase
MTEILKRKADHIDLVLEQRLEMAALASPWDQVQLTHNALPERDLLNFDLSTEFLGKHLRLPFLISSMTGGPLKAERINAHLAEAAQELGIAMGVGSQRIALLSAGSNGLTSILRRWAPKIPLYANLGAAQLRDDFSLTEIQRAVDMIEADALIIHLNCLQELMQEDGDTDWRGLLSAIETVCACLDVPVIAKEVGMGISGSDRSAIGRCGRPGPIDVAGRGGTNFIEVEAGRTADSRLRGSW